MKNCIRRFDSFLNSRTKKWSHQICFSERLKVLRMNIRLPLLVLFCVTSSQGIDYDALVPCDDNQGVMCDGDCLPAHWWCHDHPSLTDYHCMDSGVMTDDTNLCSNDDFWKQISCDINYTLHEGITHYPGERCTGCTTRTSNYCFYPQGLPNIFRERELFPTTCDCISSQSINYEPLVKCNFGNGDGVMCDGCANTLLDGVMTTS